MRARRLRLFVALLLALFGHIALLYQAPEPIRIPLEDPSYSVEVQLTAEPASINSQEAVLTDHQDQVEMSASDESKAIKEELEETKSESLQAQTGSEHVNKKENATAAEVTIKTPTSPTLHLDEITTNNINNRIKEETDNIAQEVTGSPNIESPTPIIEPEVRKDIQKVAEITATKAQKASEDSKASHQKSVKSEEITTPRVLSTTEQYEAQIYAWILNGPHSTIFSARTQENQKLNPIKVRTTWWRNGTVIYTKIIQSSGNPASDRAFKRTILTASPFPKIPEKIKGSEYTMDIQQGFID